MKTNYPGIDYAGLGSTKNRDLETGIRYGVISQRSIMPEAFPDVEYDYGKPDEAECPECGASCEAPESWGESAHCPNCDEDFEVDLPDCMESCGWSYDGDGYKLCDCLDSDIFVIKSPFYTYAQFCSPCVPGAGNLDSPFEGNPHPHDIAYWIECAEHAGFKKVYCLGHDWFEGGKAPYPVFSVETGKIVRP